MRDLHNTDPGNTCWIIQIRNVSALKCLDHDVRIDDLSDV